MWWSAHLFEIQKDIPEDGLNIDLWEELSMESDKQKTISIKLSSHLIVAAKQTEIGFFEYFGSGILINQVSTDAVLHDREFDRGITSLAG